MFYQPSKEFKKRKIRSSPAKEIEPQEIFLDKLAKEKEEKFGLSEKRLELPLSSRIFELIFLIFLIAGILLFLKTFQLQILEGKKLASLARQNTQRLFLLPKERGIIYDSKFKPLVFNQPGFDLILDKRDLPQEKRERKEILGQIFDLLKKDLSLSFDQFRKKIKENDYYKVLVLEDLSQETLILVETQLKNFPALEIQKNTIRSYPEGENFSHLLGYTGRISQKELSFYQDYSLFDRIGKAGLEKFYESILRGKPKQILVERDALGEERKREVLSEGQPGKNLVLWLQSSLQKKLKTELEQALKAVGAKKGAAVALNPKTGGVLSLVSLPSFDNNLFSRGGKKEDFEKIWNDPLFPLFNRSLAGEYPPGSTIKPLVALAALEEKVISPQKMIYDPGAIQVQHQYDPEIVYTFSDWKAHGWVDLRKAIAESCNVYFYTIGGGHQEIKGLGAKKIKDYLSLFGWGQITGIDLPGEREGLIPDPFWKESQKNENWYIGDTYLLAIGQGDILATPLQVAVAFGAIANGGTLYQPQLVKEIVDQNKNLIKKNHPKILKENFISKKNLKIVKEGMREAVTYGSAKILKDLPVKAAAKTGTAQTPQPGRYHHWVTVFAPLEDPEIVLTILIEEVWGMQAATLPVAKNVLEWYFSTHPLDSNL